MSLTIGTAPFGQAPAGRFNFEPPDTIAYVEPFPRRVLAQRGRQTVESGHLPHYAFPVADVHIEAEPVEHADGHVTVPWDAVDAWFEEHERVEVHPRDPYHRIDTFSTSRRVTVSLDGVQLADSTRAKAAAAPRSSSSRLT